jgi:hypothetical protein
MDLIDLYRHLFASFYIMFIFKVTILYQLKSDQFKCLFRTHISKQDPIIISTKLLHLLHYEL